MKKIISGLLASSVFFGTLSTVSAEPEIRILIDGQNQKYDQPPVKINDRVLVPLRDIFEALGATIEWNHGTQTVTATKGSNQIVLQIGSWFADINGSLIKLDEKARLINDRTMVPVRFVSEALGAKVDWDEGNQSVQIHTRRSAADTNELNSLTYQQAFEKARFKSVSLKNAKADITRTEKLREKAANAVIYTPTIGEDPRATAALLGLQSADISWQSAKKQYEVTLDSIAYKVKEAYNKVLQAQEKKKFAEKYLQNADSQARLFSLKYENGLVSQIEYNQKNTEYTVAKKNLEAASKALDDAYLNLNQLLGLPIDTKMTLTDVPEMKKVDIKDLDVYANRLVSESPSVWMAEQQVKLNQNKLNLFTFNDASNPETYETTKILLDKSTNTVVDTKDQLTKLVKSSYYTIKQLEDQYDVLQDKFQEAKQLRAVTQVKFDRGMAIEDEVMAAQLNVEQIKQQMLELTTQHELMVMVLEKPWVYSVK
ncbi:stalk domain-containing protein [Effusibacillus lacus]|uniref:Copper amine oxidase-like N-terminal domain-containing protein n=1 Tax=Effusibacillus lacus TaxID=1348429 RepID=A0A292YSB7_9BACL|nr:stalk domain-containing protein [Effusibacillus lacus]TCS73719.1 outer membrane efflux protein [Effusibacillus lacus]GAX92066.1 hypothetical protein EFBL_3757 [Effusibacillus lacus]